MAKDKKEKIEDTEPTEDLPESEPVNEPSFETTTGKHSNKTFIAAIASVVIIGGVLLYLYLNGMLNFS